MFSSLGLFQALACPDRDSCTRPTCIFSHRTDLQPPPLLQIPIDEASTVHAKRSVDQVASSDHTPDGEPPRKVRKLTSKKVVTATGSHTTHSSTGVPVLRVNAARSQVPIQTRQAMLKSLYDHFVTLYRAILPGHPTIASDHALKQESEVYKASNKQTYRNAVINSIASLKRRAIPESITHPSVGTEAEIAARAETRKSLNSLQLTRANLESLVLSLDDMKKWGYIVEIPGGPGECRPSEEGHIMKCERCTQHFMVKPHPDREECLYHWGRPYTRTVNGEKTRIYSCCSQPTEGEGCVRGPHVFYESKPEDLHIRHPFSFSRPVSKPSDDAESTADPPDTALEVVSLDCEMVYTTGGMRVARVSVVDGSGAGVFDELVRMDEGVEVIDYNTRFSGITAEQHSTALLPLSSIRKSLDDLISEKTIIIGHALDNDLKTLRMIHYRCVDTAILFPHPSGPPYRRALRVLAKEHLGISIQTGDETVGHSSVEDSIATLDLVRWHVLKNNAAKGTR